MTLRVSIVNHKGGVGKTTLAYHLAQVFMERGLRVMCVDADPQCNLSSFFLTDKELDGFLNGSRKGTGRTLFSGLTYKKPLHVVRRSGVALVVGDVSLLEYEQRLAEAWSASASPAGLIALTDFGRRLGEAEERLDIDLTFVDTAPSLGALNRTIVLESDFLIVPLGLDLFSARGLKTLGVAIETWAKEWERISAFAPSALLSRVEGPVIGGYVVQRMPARKTRADIAAINRIQNRVREDLIAPLRQLNPRRGRGQEFDLRLGEVPEFRSAAQAQELREPIWHKEPGSRDYFEHVADRLERRMYQMRGARPR